MIPTKVIALIPRLGTSFDAECIATRDAIGRLLKAAGIDWCDLAEACAAPRYQGELSSSPSPGRAQPSGRGASFGDLARAARDLDGGRLTARERIFVADMVRRGFAFQPSARQSQWLGDILDRLQRRAAA